MMIQQDKRKVNPLAGNVEAKGQRQAPREPEEKGEEEGKNSIVKKKKKTKGEKREGPDTGRPKKRGSKVCGNKAGASLPRGAQP